MVEEFRGEQEKKLESGLLSRMGLRKYRAVAARLEQDLQTLRREGMDGGARSAADVWNRLRELFGEDSDRYEELVEAAGQMLENAFNFMEAAFAAGQEMVLFVTELNTGFYSVRFLQEYECERYYQYNKNLLFSEEEKEIERRIAER